MKIPSRSNLLKKLVYYFPFSSASFIDYHPIRYDAIPQSSQAIPTFIGNSLKPGENNTLLLNIIYLKDSSTNWQTLLKLNGLISFSCKNDHFTANLLASIIKKLDGEWIIIDLGNKVYKIDWTYQAVPANPFSRLVVRVFLIKAVRRLIINAIAISIKDLNR